MYSSRKGEIATALTILTLGVMLVGTIIGANQSLQKTAKTLFSRAEETKYKLDCTGGGCTVKDFKISIAQSRGSDQALFSGNLCFTDIPPLNTKYFVKILNGADQTPLGQVGPVVIQTPAQARCSTATVTTRGLAFSSALKKVSGDCSKLKMVVGYESKNNNLTREVPLGAAADGFCTAETPVPAGSSSGPGPINPTVVVGGSTGSNRVPTSSIARPTLTVVTNCGKPCTNDETVCGAGYTCVPSCNPGNGTTCPEIFPQPKVCRASACTSVGNCICGSTGNFPTVSFPTTSPSASCTFSAVGAVRLFDSNGKEFSKTDSQYPALLSEISLVNGKGGTAKPGLDGTVRASGIPAGYKAGDIATIQAKDNANGLRNWTWDSGSSQCSTGITQKYCQLLQSDSGSSYGIPILCGANVNYTIGLRRVAGAPSPGLSPTSTTSRPTSSPTNATNATGLMEVKLVTVKNAADAGACTREDADRKGTMYTKTDDITGITLRGLGIIAAKQFFIPNLGTSTFSQHNMPVGNYIITTNTTPKGYDIADSCKNKQWNVTAGTNVNQVIKAALILVPRSGPEPTVAKESIYGTIQVDDPKLWESHEVYLQNAKGDLDSQILGPSGGTYRLEGIPVNQYIQVIVKSKLKNFNTKTYTGSRTVQLPLSNPLDFKVTNPIESKQSGQKGFAGVVRLVNFSDPASVDGEKKYVFIGGHNSDGKFIGSHDLKGIAFSQFPYQFSISGLRENFKDGEKYDLYVGLRYERKNLIFSQSKIYTAPNDKLEFILDMNSINPFAMNVENASGKDISAITITRCNKIGFCENSRQIISIKPGDNSSVAPEKGTIKDEDVVSVSCTIEYGDGSKAACPKQTVSSAKPVSLAVKAQGDKVAVQQREIPLPPQTPSSYSIADADIDKNGVVNSLDYAQLLKAYEIDASDSKYDINKDDSLDALDISIILETLGEKVN